MSSSHFDEVATVYDETLPAHVVEHYLRKRTRFVLAHCPRGTGAGRRLWHRARSRLGWPRRATTMAGADPSAGMLSVLRERAPAVEAVEATGMALPFPDGRFDVVLTVAALHHVADAGDVRRTLAEMVRVTRPGGRVLVWDHNPRNPYWGRLMAPRAAGHG